MLCPLLASSAMWASIAYCQQAGGDFFKSKVEPVLTICRNCHNQQLRTSGLALDSREGVLKGGKRGAVVKSGHPEESLLVQAVSYTGELKMPPTGKLSQAQIEALTSWVKLGLPWAETQTAETPKQLPRADYWAFQLPKRRAPPEVKNGAWARNPIDSFILARLEEQGIQPSPEADRPTLLRRVSLDLTGLLPTPKEIDEFLADSQPDAYERLVNRLLASPHYGERWGRHWLDVARYADSNGYNIDDPRPIWKYRDWVINALNSDMPFDQFVIEQIGGDLLPNPTTDQLIATGFHRNTLLNLEGGIDFEQYRVEAVVDRVATTGVAFLGLTLGCARCHDHKYDPIKQHEFYQLFAFFNNIDEMSNGRDREDALSPILELPTPEEKARREAFDVQLELLKKEQQGYEKSLPAGVEKTKDPGWQQRDATIKALIQQKPNVDSTLVMRELPKPRQAHVLLGGDFLRPGVAVAPDVPAVLPPLNVPLGHYPNRLDLARWLVAPQNPLTARVTVNRIWQHYFGKGVVETENDFGTQGSPPTHPELLDWLASEFIKLGWSQKALHRLIVTSATYRQSSKSRPDLAAIDPGNRLLGRQSGLRLEAETIRDAALIASGLFSPTIGGPSVYPPIPEGALSVTQVRREWPTATGPDRYRRGMYTFFLRSAPYPAFMVFDAPDTTSACTRRNRSNTPLQALTLLNDEGFFEFAQAMGGRILREAPPGDRARLDYAFRLALSRTPKPLERQRLAQFLASQYDGFRTDPEAARELVPKDKPQKTDVTELAVWISVSRVLLNLDEFMTRE